MCRDHEFSLGLLDLFGYDDRGMPAAIVLRGPP